MNGPRERVSEKVSSRRGNTLRMVWLREMKSLSPLEFVREKGLNHQRPVRVHVAKGVPIDDGVCKEVNVYADPVDVAVIDGEAQMIVKKRVDTTAARVETEPRERVVSLEGAGGSDGRV